MPTPLFKLFLLALVSLSAQAANLSGAGSTFAEPLYRKWAEQYQKQAGAGSVVNYEAVGSGEGVKRIATKQVDFGASDEPLKRAELDEKGLRQFPVAMGAVVPVVNLPGVQAGSLKLNADVLAKIYTGRIKRWNDTEILALNEGIPANALDRAIKPVYRADSSGSTFAFSYYLNARSPDWKKSQGVSKELKGVSGTAAKGSGAVVEAVKTTPGAIAYAEYGRALRDKLNMVQLPNRVGVYVKASPEAILAAAQFDAEKLLYSADPDFYLVLADNDTYAGWPMTTLTFTLVPKSGPGAQKVLEFIYWGYKHGDGASRELGYVPLSDSMKIGVRKAWSRQYGYKAGL
ncbi:phosphate ABC transporter substrate-binding protein PstS [Chitinimonas sp. JJ19]|uniref:phosphate ABC transporter substrate-binding protein PstS n=1 Tax=Chitinimonas sp. JJ19 TaxID=3109352 RepID=UPI001A51BF09|nr:phosphate ABC transporter substrate-binding protein PstS [Chitinimonas sp.]